MRTCDGRCAADLPSLAGSSPEAWGVEVDVRMSDGTPFGGVWQPISGGTFVGRHFSFRIRLTSLREDVTPRVEDLALVLDMPDRVEGVENVLCPAVGLRINFDPAFRNVPSVVATARDAPSGARLSMSLFGARTIWAKTWSSTATISPMASASGRAN